MKHGHVAATLTQGEAPPLASPLSTLDAENETVRLHMDDGTVLRGWMSRRFLRGEPTYWTRDGGTARCVTPIGWSMA